MYYVISYISIFCREALPNTNATVTIDIQHPDLISIKPSNFTITPDIKKWIIYVKGLNAGHSIVSANVTPSNITE